jgi:hypothetical protein
MTKELAFQPVILYVSLGVCGVVALGRILLGWALDAS